MKHEQSGKIVLVSLLLLQLLFLVWGWFFDASHPISGIGWADQTYYHTVALRLASLELPQPWEMHFQFGYPLLGAVGYKILPAYPFFFVSCALFCGTFYFLFAFFKKHFGQFLGAIFLFLLFSWDFQGRVVGTLFDVFVVPWNNQVSIFVMAAFFYTFSKEGPLPALHWTWLGLACGFAMATREEHALFFLPLLLATLAIYKASWRCWLYALAAYGAGYLPHLLIKLAATESLLDSGRKHSYPELLGRYVNWQKFINNFMPVIIDSRLSDAPWEKVGRPSLLQANPLLAVAPFGLFMLALARKYKALLLVAVSLAFLFFYLSGDNVSAEKLKFHCLRYPSAAYPALYFCSFYFLYQLLRGVWKELAPNAESGADEKT